MQRRHRLFQRRIAIFLLAGMFATAGTSMLLLKPSANAYADAKPFDTSTAITRNALTDKMTVVSADNPVVKSLINGRDEGQTPEGFNPNHATGDTGNAYAFSQCTWWAYVRRHQLGLPAGSHMGNGADWANTARKLGYWVDNSPRVGDVICFGRGQYDSDLTYGHVGIVENVGQDGSITTSECGAAYNGKPFSRTFTAEQAKQLQFIHY